MSEGTSLDELLNGPAEPTVETPQEPQIEAAEAAEPETIGQPRDEHGRFAPKEETGVETQAEAPAEGPQPVPPTEQAGLPPAEYAALKDERRKRQELERELAELRRAPPHPAQQEPPADFWDNPEGFMAQRFDQFGEQLLQRFQQQQLTERLDASEEAAMGRHADFEDAKRAFQQAAMANPSLVKQMTMASDPAEFAYTTGKRAMEFEQVGSIDELLKAERAKWEAEARAAIPAAPTLPSTTATDGSVGVRAGPAWAGPKPLDQILG